ncbi:MAG: hypothetical protein H7A23_25850 [Leptospiraceae bacterium]|nr:hypothetical protein [Leptospiraceae bacterium]MCP5497993.1 hypothetical protein [Leptospiraceae bacterium]
MREDHNKQKNEYDSFLRNAIAWRGSATPRVLARVFFSGAYALVIKIIFLHHPEVALDITPFEVAGIVLSILLVMRTNAGYDRWWEARKVWGGIVNQSRNLAIMSRTVLSSDRKLGEEIFAYLKAFPYACMDALRNEKPGEDLRRLLLDKESLKKWQHIPNYIHVELTRCFQEAEKKSWINSFQHKLLHEERLLLINYIGMCERILKTPLPFVYAVKLSRFILIFLLLLPFGLIPKVLWLTPFVTMVVAYALLSLDQIGKELQNPFSFSNLSHLPLDDICATIEKNVDEIASIIG